MEKRFFLAKISTSISVYFFSLLILIVAVIWGSFLYLKGQMISGPFIFGDELAYFSFAKSIFHHESLELHTQYGPLFPFLISTLFNVKNIFTTYHLIRLFNILIFLSASIPAYLLAKEIFKNKWLTILLPVCVLLTPYSGVVYLIWAEPLYIPLFYWACFILYHHIKNPTLSNSLIVSIFLALLYYTKPASGLVVLIAAFLTLCMHAFIEKKSQSLQATLLNGIVLLTSFLLILPWLVHYHYLHVSLVGYPAVTGSFMSRLNHDGYATILFEIIRGVFYQFSYFIIGSFGLINLSIVLFIAKGKNLNSVERAFMLFSLLCVLGLVALSALGMSSMPGLDYKMPQGRYFSLLLPLLMTLSLHFLFKTASSKTNIKLLIGIIYLLTGIAILASPFYIRSPLVFNSMPEIAPYLYIMDQGNVVWRATITEPSLFLRIGMPIIFAIFVTFLILFRRGKYTPFIASLIIFSLIAFSAFTEIYYINILGESQSGLSNIYRYLKKNHIDISQVAFDKEMESGNVQFLSPFWTGELSIYLNAEDVVKKPVAMIPSYFISCASKLAINNKLFSAYGCTIYDTSRNKTRKSNNR